MEGATGKNVIVGCVYKHPNFDLGKFNTMYSPLLEKMCLEDKNIHIMGDFNINLINASAQNPRIANFLNTNLENSLEPSILCPTRITLQSQTLIDNIFSNNLDQKYLAANLTLCISDHLPQILILKQERSHTEIKNEFFQDFK